MPTYSFKASDSCGNIMKGVAFYDNKRSLLLSLSQSNLHLLKTRITFNTKKVTSQELSETFLFLEQMDAAGVPLLDSLQQVLGCSRNASLSYGILDMFQQVKNGNSLSASMQRHPRIFPPICSRIVMVCERTGHLHQGFAKLAEHFSWENARKLQIKKAVRYPLILSAAVCAVFLILMTYMMPQVQHFIESLNSQLPLSTRLLLNFSHWVQLLLPYFSIFLAVILFALYLLRKFSLRAKRKLEHAILKLPLIGPQIQSLAIIKFIHIFHVSFSCHLDILECLKLAVHSAGNSFIQGEFARIPILIDSGVNISKAFEQCKLMPESIAKMLAVGEVTGNLASLLNSIEQYLERDNKNKFEEFIAYIEPFMVLLLGAIILWIVVGVFFPIYDHLATVES